jgi:hypothetical protein
MNGFQVEMSFQKDISFITGFFLAKDCACTFFNRKC